MQVRPAGVTDAVALPLDRQPRLSMIPGTIDVKTVIDQTVGRQEVAWVYAACHAEALPELWTARDSILRMPLDLLDVVLDPHAQESLRSYFATYTGRWFEALGGGGDRPATRFAVTAEDLVAVQMLSVHVPAEVGARLLEGDLGRQMTDYLVQIETGVDLGTPEAADMIKEGSSAHRAWALLKDKTQHGVDWVIAGKLLARKRPRLIPVYDRVIRCQLGNPDKFWVPLHDRLARDDQRLGLALAELHARVGLPATVSRLRVLERCCGCATRTSTGST